MTASAGADTVGAARRPVLVRATLVVWLSVAVWLVATIGVRFAYVDRILPGTTMAGLSLGGLSEASARRVVATALAPPRRVVVAAAGRRFVIDPAAVGYSVDAAATADRARDAGRDGIVSTLGSTIPSLVAPRRLEPVVRIDRARLAAQIAAIAQSIDRPARAGAVRVDRSAPGGIAVTAPRAQRALLQSAARTALLSALRDRRVGPVALPVRRTGGASRAAVEALARRAREYLRTPLRLAAGRRTLALPTRRTAALIALRRGPGTGGGALALDVDPSAVGRLVEDLAHDLDRAPADARITAPARPRVVVDAQGDFSWRARQADVSVRAGAAGRRLQQPDAVAALTDAVRRGRHRVALALARVPMRITTTSAQAVTSLLGTFTTRYPCCQPRVRNIRLIAEAVDGTVVMPGERFSLNQRTGERTRAAGYVKAPFIADGKLAESIGGGVSQVSTTLYNAVYFAGLQIDAHRPHSFYIDRYPPGREATLNFPDIDLRWTNDTPAPVLVRAATDETSVVVSLYGADTRRRVRARTGRRVPLPGGDFGITVTRVLRFRDGRVARQAYTTRYEEAPPPD